VLGALIEKQRTTPDVYPLTLNALRQACNQATNRDPVVDYSEADVRAAIDRLEHRRWARLAGVGRAPKFRHLLDEALGLAPDELALLCLLMLRGEQTSAELRSRSERLQRFASREEVERTLERLAARALVERRPRRPGQKEERYAQLLGGGALPSRAEAPVAPPPSAAVAPASDDGLAGRVERLERELAALRADLDALRAELGA
jgi:uncharacterized protein YceH (UPF0502 family)